MHADRGCKFWLVFKGASVKHCQRETTVWYSPSQTLFHDQGNFSVPVAIFYTNNAEENCPYLFHHASECKSSFEIFWNRKWMLNWRACVCKRGAGEAVRESPGNSNYICCIITSHVERIKKRSKEIFLCTVVCVFSTEGLFSLYFYIFPFFETSTPVKWLIFCTPPHYSTSQSFGLYLF